MPMYVTYQEQEYYQNTLLHQCWCLLQQLLALCALCLILNPNNHGALGGIWQHSMRNTAFVSKVLSNVMNHESESYQVNVVLPSQHCDLSLWTHHEVTETLQWGHVVRSPWAKNEASQRSHYELILWGHAVRSLRVKSKASQGAHSELSFSEL